MKKRLQKIAEDLVPLSSKQNLILFLIIACVFQFLFFFTPALAAETVAIQEQEEVISLGNLDKSDSMEENAQKIADTITVSNALPKNRDYTVKSVSTHVITAYNSEPGQTDDSPCITANGFNVCAHGEEDTIAANFLKFGTKVRIPELFGDRVFIVRDRMNQKHPNRVDIWMKEKSAAIKFGVKTAKIEVLE